MERALVGQVNDPHMYPDFIAIAEALGGEREAARQRAQDIAEAEHPDDTPNLAALYLRVLAELAGRHR